MTTESRLELHSFIGHLGIRIVFLDHYLRDLRHDGDDSYSKNLTSFAAINCKMVKRPPRHDF